MVSTSDKKSMAPGVLVRYLTVASFCVVIIASVLVLPVLKDGAITGKSYGFLWTSAGMMVVCCVAFLVRRSPVVLALSATDGLVAAYVLYTFVRLLYTPQASWYNVRFLELVFASGIFYVNKVLLRDFQKYRAVLFFLLATALFQALFGLLQLYGFLDRYHAYFQVTGTFFNPAAYAAYLVSVFPLALGTYYISMRCTALRYLAVAAGLAILVVLPATLSRAAWIALVVAAAVFLAGYARLRPGRVAVCILVTVIVFLSVALFQWKRDSSVGRMFIWKITWQVIRDNPVFGVGLDQYTPHFGHYQRAYFRDNPHAAADEVMTAGKGEYAFNEFLFIAAEKGFFGLTLFVGILVSAIREHFKYCDRGDPAAPLRTTALSGVAGLVAFSFFSYPFSVTPVFLNLYIFMSILSCTDDARAGVSFRWAPGAVARALFAMTMATLIVAVTWKLCIQYRALRDWKTASFLKEYRDYPRALKFMQALEPALHGNGQFMFEYGQTLALQGRYTEGIAVLQHAATLTADPYLFNALGLCYQETGQFAKAEQSYQNAVYLIPHKFYPRYLLAKLYLEMGEEQRALTVARQIMSMSVKVPSQAVDEIKAEMARLIETNAHQPINEQ
ncbi:O-antigen ligase family protein [Dawidia soli]|uniref:O-antigen ligase family protein n=1 Tax=Dawidia soli TaxID=2782352 RepID=A0AAP2DI72_9BACT|nr:O-antigen ligase family protein [Dawidia soli]MBT1689832.1 O-antigen ligase family protein [Dawidia soli]